MITKKPPHKTPEDFIKGAKAELAQAPEGQKDKTFLLRIPYGTWDKARRIAGSEAISLHDYIIQAIEEKVERDRG